jgi:hypothetical protein
MLFLRPYRIFSIALILIFSAGFQLKAQTEPNSKWGPNDTILVQGIIYEGERMPYKEMPMVYVSKMSDRDLERYLAEWTRLRNAVYVTYPYARIAGRTINDINAHLVDVKSRREKKDYIKTREKELREQFTSPMENLSVYQGKILMKLINRQTGNNCYEIIKEYKNGLTARLYQTVAFFFGGDLKQPYDLTDKTDHQIEAIVKEIDGMWYNNPYKPGIQSN